MVGLLLLSLLVGACYVLLPHIDDEMIFFGVPVYGALLLAMVWCAISRAETKSKYNLYLQHLDVIPFQVYFAGRYTKPV